MFDIITFKIPANKFVGLTVARSAAETFIIIHPLHRYQQLFDNMLFRVTDDITAGIPETS